ncbi:MAG: C40 family peptidase [Salinarimonas sp.]|nr:C40 family peptidase [Salinarimonas sp.]
MSDSRDFDPRLTPARADLAAAHLRGRIDAPRYAEGALMRVVATYAALRREPRSDSPLDTQLLAGEAFIVYATDENGFAWGQSVADGYVGYVARDDLDPQAREPTHRVTALRSPLYPGPSLKLPTERFLSLNARVQVIAVEGAYARIDCGAHGGGYVHTAHIAPLDTLEPDPVLVAERFLHVPYLWGGRTSLGLDCSALVQLALAAAGLYAPRDSDMQEEQLGEALPVDDTLTHLARGDLVFWKGHVGIMCDGQTLLHANGHHMATAREPLAQARARIAEKSFGPITGIRRLRSRAA